MGFHLHDQVPFIIELYDSRIVVEDRQEPWNPLRYLVGRPLDICLEQALDRSGATVFVLVSYRGVENLVFAVFRPCLRNGFQLDIGGLAGESDRRASADSGFAAEILANRVHLLEAEREYTLPADPHEFVVGHIEVEGLDDGLLMFACYGEGKRYTAVFSKLFGVGDEPLLDQGIRQESARDCLGLAPVDLPLDKILFGGEHSAFSERGPENIGDCLARGFTHVVGHARLVADLDYPRKTFGQRPVERGDLDDGIGKEIGPQRLHMFAGEIGENRINPKYPDALDGDLEVFDNVLLDRISGGIQDLRPKTNLYSVCFHGAHYSLPYLTMPLPCAMRPSVQASSPSPRRLSRAAASSSGETISTMPTPMLNVFSISSAAIFPSRRISSNIGSGCHECRSIAASTFFGKMRGMLSVSPPPVM